MSDAVVIAIVVGTVQVILAGLGIVTLIVTWHLKKHVNSRLDTIIAQAEKLAHAAGVQEERDRGSEDS